jgi:hypothetical protein
MSKGTIPRSAYAKVFVRNSQTGQFAADKHGANGRGVIRDVLGPDGKVRRRLDPEVVEQAIRDSGRKK